MRALHVSLEVCHNSSSRDRAQNLSGTKHMLNGAALGNGIYTADDRAVSLGYSGGGNMLLGSAHLLAAAAARTIRSRDLALVAACRLCPNPAFVNIQMGCNVVQETRALRMTHVLVYGPPDDELH